MMDDDLLRDATWEALASPGDDHVTMRFTARVCPQSLVWDQDDATRDKLLLSNQIAINDWVEYQSRRGRDVIEDEIETGFKRMRPLRPEDV